jgi:hypothetical protein
MLDEAGNRVWGAGIEFIHVRGLQIEYHRT